MVRSQENIRSFGILYYNYSIYLRNNKFSIFIHSNLKEMPIMLACQTLKVYEHWNSSLSYEFLLQCYGVDSSL